MHAGLVELSTFNLIDAVMLSPHPPSGDWLLVSLTPETTTIAIMRGPALRFYRRRADVDSEPLTALIHRTAMFHEDRMGGSAFARVVYRGASFGDGGIEQSAPRCGRAARHSGRHDRSARDGSGPRPAGEPSGNGRRARGAGRSAPARTAGGVTMRINLATRPFYNERVITALLVVVALVAVGLTVFNVTELISLSSRRTALQAQIARDEAATKAADASAQSVQRTVDRAALGALAFETGEANALISERTFSWTTFLGLIEKTLPQDVHLLSVAPRVDDGQMWITMLVLAKTA